ncbi:MAG: DUF92 domain-containing protein [archaeon]|nr:DUF92 domain-containing protein [archaeon]
MALLETAFQPTFMETMAYIFLSLFFSFFSHSNKSFSNNGVIFGNIVGFLVFFLGGIQGFSALAVFFALGEFATIHSRKKTSHDHEQRTSLNIAGNAGAGIIALMFSNYAAFFGSISAALSDTLSSEIGLLSKKNPRLITNMKEAAPGTDGAVTILGFAGAFFGALVISVVHLFFFGSPMVAFFIFLGGVAGTVVDSFLGAIFQQKKLLDNNQVNFIATASGAIVVFALQALTLGA